MTRVSMIIQSLLNDAMIEMDSNPTLAQKRLQFVKYLVHMFPDTDTRIDEDIVYQQFKLGLI
jgi:hypothetical protein